MTQSADLRLLHWSVDLRCDIEWSQQHCILMHILRHSKLKDEEVCVGLTPQLTQHVCIWFAVKLQWNFVQTKTALHICFGRQSLSDPRIYFWRTQFQRGRVQIIDLHCRAKSKSGRSWANIWHVESLVADDRRITIPQIMAETGIRHTTVQCILKEDLHLSKKCAKFVPSLLTDHHIQRWQAICDFWSYLQIQSPAVFRYTVTMDESWVYC